MKRIVVRVLTVFLAVYGAMFFCRNNPDPHEGHDHSAHQHDHAGHEGHDHCNHDNHEGHDHDNHANHDGHDHGNHQDEVGVTLNKNAQKIAGIRLDSSNIDSINAGNNGG